MDRRWHLVAVATVPEGQCSQTCGKDTVSKVMGVPLRLLLLLLLLAKARGHHRSML